MSEEIVDGRESYEFTWVGKREAIAEAGRPTTKTLRPDLDESVDFEKSENVFITGDNLEVLKILQESYLGKIDMIYIDPPYNTGKDFVYSDKYQKSDDELKEDMDLLDEEGRQVIGLTKNEKSSARYHSDWLNMMYPRLRLARNLLKDSGVIFISIDNNEQANLKAICDEIFGEENFVADFVWTKKEKTSGVPPLNMILPNKEYILCYKKQNIVKFKGQERSLKSYKQDENGRWWRLMPIQATGKQDSRFDIEDPLTGNVYSGNWAFSESTIKEMIAQNRIAFPKGGKGLPTQIVYADELKNGTPIFENLGLFESEIATKSIIKLLGSKLFDFPKPDSLIKFIINQASKNSAVVLDFFGGSGTTADAVMQLNVEDGGNRKFILCTLDEKVADKSAAKEAGYETIDQISRERIRRAAAKIQEEHPELIGKQDFGFKAYKLDSSNFKDVSARPDAFVQGDIFDSVSNIKEGRTDLDLLFQVMLGWGMDLSLPIESQEIAGSKVYNVDDDSLLACFDEEISEEVIRHMAEAQPLRAIFRDSSFANSASKINVSEIFKELAPSTKVKVV